MNYFDLHCDTLYEMYEKDAGFFGNGCQVSFENADMFNGYARVCAIWTKAGISDDDAYRRYKKILAHARKNANDKIAFCTSGGAVSAALEERKIPVIIAVEGASLLGGDISRLDELYADGVRFLTLVWKNSDCIGGAFNTNDGLTDFGAFVVKRCGELGMVVDVSHASRKTTAQALKLADECGARIVATHSNSYSCCAHERNLSDGEACEIASRGGVVGLSFVPAHLRQDGNADVSDVLRHAEHYLSLGLENSICIGADFDGVSTLPAGVVSERDMIKTEKLFAAAGISEKTRNDIFWENAKKFCDAAFG